MKSSSVYKLHGMREPRKTSRLLTMWRAVPAWVRALIGWAWSVAAVWIMTKYTRGLPWLEAEVIIVALLFGTAFAAAAHWYRAKHPL
ncbi:MAG: hypothetical protein Q4P78_03320 [Rothia sp. (in: high G+C Gram-positive bacteria)]|uniref:hypothetical protein n=1 Tax=Rothia sp. (in: high G+C Gram-positive bacteria) TaxID=1885016 RepID=UPI0026DF10EB|nr:hypothetical protein [Rothia sp. (in: high G+C Gram-positive bacteria)]MDO5750219.1 hypothetical protein [Rothia sp. (in: high G+C Gram-positive bacteria)]